MLKKHTEDECITFLDGKRKAEVQLNVASKPKRTSSLEPEVVNLDSGSDGEDEDEASKSVYHAKNKFTATVTPYNKTGWAWNQMNSYLTGPPKKHPDYKEFNRMCTVANKRFRDVQPLPENLRLWGILGCGLRGRTKNSP